MSNSKNIFAVSLLVISLILSGCLNGSVDTSEPAEIEPSIFDQLMRYVIFNFEWRDNENIVIQVSHKESDKAKIKPDEHFVKTFLYNVYTDEQKLLYAGGTDISKKDIVFGESKMYIYDETECQIYNGEEFKYSHYFGEEAKTRFDQNFLVSINKDGLCAARMITGDIAVFPINELENYQVIKQATEELIKSVEGNMIKASWYSKPVWSEDGQYVTFLEIGTYSESAVIWMVDKSGNSEKVFEFYSTTNFTLTDDNKYMIGICEPLYMEDKKEIRVYNVEDLSYKQFFFEDPVNNISFEKIKIADTYGSKIALKCTNLEGKNVTAPILLFDWNTGEKKWLTPPDYLAYVARFSPSGEELLVYGRIPRTEYKHQSKFQLIEIE